LAVGEVRRLGKRLLLFFGDDLVLVIHLMIAGRLRWREHDKGKWLPNGLFRLEFPTGRLTLTEAGSKRRAKIHVCRPADIPSHDPGGLELYTATVEEFLARLRLRNHTLKRALTDPTLFSGIGNAFSDEILWEAQLSPISLTQRLGEAEGGRLFQACLKVLQERTALLIAEAGDKFPENVTAFHPSHNAHGQYLKPCRRCQTPIQRIRYKDNETNYCPVCQTGGRLLADRALSRLLKSEYPRTWEDLSSL
jgi:formamidopyrimidine-DNA glycosylase